jgi:prepilin-type N-terminal cleavage/methylation domain-containing protein
MLITKSKTRNGFTLIELLVVVAIIGVLVSLLLPALQRVRTMGKITLCTANLRQWGNVHAMYADENNGWFVLNPRWDSKSPEIVHYSQFNMYFTDKFKMPEKIFYCPFRPDWYPQYWNLAAWGGSGQWFSMIGYTYLAEYDETAYPYFYNEYHSPGKVDKAEGWWVLMTDICRGSWNANHIINGELATSVLCADGRVEHQTGGGFLPYFSAGNGFDVQWRKTQ